MIFISAASNSDHPCARILLEVILLAGLELLLALDGDHLPLVLLLVKVAEGGGPKTEAERFHQQVHIEVVNVHRYLESAVNSERFKDGKLAKKMKT